MTRMPKHVGQPKQHSHEDRQMDLYETPPCAVRALLEVESLPRVIWEPACGPGSIVRALCNTKHEIYASDIVNYKWGHVTCDFLKLKQPPPNVQCILTNPPYKLAAEFVRQALRLAPKVVMLLRLAFLESVSRTDILDGGKLARVYIFRNRLPMMHRDGWKGPKASSSIAFCWMVWERSHRGSAKMHRISWGENVSERCRG
jgi:hypothetical protein